MSTGISNFGATGTPSHKDLKLSNLVVDQKLVVHGMLVQNIKAGIVDSLSGFHQNGDRVLFSIPGGQTIVGNGAAPNNKGAPNLTVVGSDAAGNMTTGANNTIIGDTSGNAITTGHDNTIVGAVTGDGSWADSSKNVVVGSLSIFFADNNTLIGYGTGSALGGGCLVLGSEASAHSPGSIGLSPHLTQSSTAGGPAPTVFLEVWIGTTAYKLPLYPA